MAEIYKNTLLKRLFQNESVIVRRGAPAARRNSIRLIRKLALILMFLGVALYYIHSLFSPPLLFASIFDQTPNKVISICFFAVTRRLNNLVRMNLTAGKLNLHLHYKVFQKLTGLVFHVLSFLPIPVILDTLTGFCPCICGLGS